MRSRSRLKVRSKVFRKRYTKRHTRKRSKKKTKKRRSRKLQSGGGPVDWASNNPGWAAGGILGIIALSALVVGKIRKEPRKGQDYGHGRVDVSTAREDLAPAQKKWKVRIPAGFVPEKRGKGENKAYYYKFKVLVPNAGTLLSGIKSMDIRGEGELDVEDRYSGFEMLRGRIVEGAPELGKLEFPDKGNLQGVFDALTDSARMERGKALGNWLENSLNLLFAPVPGELAYLDPEEEDEEEKVKAAKQKALENILEARSFMEDFIVFSNEKVLQELYAEDIGPDSTGGEASPDDSSYALFLHKKRREREEREAAAADAK